MKIKIILFGIALVLMLCISPVAAVSGTDFEIYINKENGKPVTYTYYNQKNPYDEYIKVHSSGTDWKYSIVTFKPANIEGAPVMIVDTYKNKVNIRLPRSVDDWEIKYYSNGDRLCPFCQPDDKYLKNAGVVNLNEEFEKYIPDGLILELGWGQFISQWYAPWPRWSIPSVD